MASDEIVWQIINQQFCSFKISTTKNQTFCRNEHNTIERAHLPNRLWEKIKLPQNYQAALKVIDDRLIYWPKFLVHKCKQRLTRLTQVSIRMRRIAKEDERLGEKLVPRLAPKIKRREATRERKAEAAAKLERTIERELINRLRDRAYGDQPLNVSEKIWEKVLNGMEQEGKASRDKDLDRGFEDELEDEEELDVDEEEADGAVTYVSDLDESEDDLGDIEDMLDSDDGGSADETEPSASEDNEDSEEESAQKKTAAGDKRKRGRVVRKPKKKSTRKAIFETDFNEAPRETTTGN